MIEKALDIYVSKRRTRLWNTEQPALKKSTLELAMEEAGDLDSSEENGSEGSDID